METRQFKQGEVIFREWTLGDNMYEIKSGKVGIYANYGQEGETLLTELGEGRIFGELSVVDLGPRSAAAVALADTEANEITFNDLRSYFAEEPERIVEIVRSISRRLRELTNDYADVCEAIRALDSGEAAEPEQAKGLLARIKRFVTDYNKSQELIAKLGGGALIGMYNGRYVYYI